MRLKAKRSIEKTATSLIKDSILSSLEVDYNDTFTLHYQIQIEKAFKDKIFIEVPSFTLIKSMGFPDSIFKFSEEQIEEFTKRIEEEKNLINADILKKREAIRELNK